MTLPQIPTVTLNDETEMPVVGLGTYQLNANQGADAIVAALHQGYRLLDSAFNYENEGAVGNAVRRSGIARDEILVTSKLPGRRQGYGEAIDTVKESAYRMGLDYIDIYLIHWPNPSVDQYVEGFQALIDLQKEGVLRTVGVCNFLESHLKRVIAETGVTPAINQIELHPYAPQLEALAIHQRLGITTQSWGPIGRGGAVSQEAVIGQIARAHGKTPMQVILRWHFQLGTVPLPKSANPARQLANIDIFDFELTADDVAAITGLARPDGRSMDPATHEEM